MRTGVILALIAACGGTDAPADVAGDYAVNTTNRMNGCMFDNWTEGNSTSNIPVTLAQSGSDVTASIQGAIGGYVEAIAGTRTFTGDVSGSHVLAELHGQRSATKDNCTYTVLVTMSANLSGDTLSGTLTYTALTNQDPTCGYLQTCESVQDFNGLRPPR